MVRSRWQSGSQSSVVSFRWALLSRLRRGLERRIPDVHIRLIPVSFFTGFEFSEPDSRPFMDDALVMLAKVVSCGAPLDGVSESSANTDFPVRLLC